MYGFQCVVLACMCYVWFYNVLLYDCEHIENIVIIATLNTNLHTYLKYVITASLQNVVLLRLVHFFHYNLGETLHSLKNYQYTVKQNMNKTIYVVIICSLKVCIQMAGRYITVGL